MRATLLLLAVAAALVARPAGAEERAKRSFSVSGAVIGFYQKYISDLRYGHCRFDPSCSHYCSDAIAAEGFFAGVALTADRLIRCNAGAVHYHTKKDDGRLADAVGGPAAVRSRPEVPRWLLPEDAIPPFPLRAVEAQPLDLHWPQRKNVAELQEYAAFADALAVDGDCWRAETEYKRVAFLAQAEEVDRWAAMKTGICYYHWKKWQTSASAFEEASTKTSSAEEDNVARFMAAASYFNQGLYSESAGVLEACDVQPEPGVLQDGGYALGERIGLLSGLCSMASGDWGGAAAGFENVVATYPHSPNRNQALFLKWKSEQGEANVPRKSPNLAATFSIVPGMGQMYSGRYLDGFRHLMFDGLLMFSVYQLLANENYAAGYLLAGFTLPFYAGNIVGAKHSARSYNATRRAAYVADTIEAAGGR